MDERIVMTFEELKKVITEDEWSDLGRPPVEDAFVRPHALSAPLIDSPMPSAQGDGDPGISALPDADLEFFIDRDPGDES